MFLIASDGEFFPEKADLVCLLNFLRFNGGFD